MTFEVDPTSATRSPPTGSDHESSHHPASYRIIEVSSTLPQDRKTNHIVQHILEFCPESSRSVSPGNDRRVRAKDMRRSLSTTANTSHDKDETLVHISVRPTRPFFFSGETFEAKITLENVRSKNARNGSGVRTAIDPRDRARASIDGYAQRNTAGPDHRRSSAPNFGPRRLGLIGKHEDAQDQEVEVPTNVDEATSLPATPKRKSHLAGRSQSVDFDSLREQDLARTPGRKQNPLKSHPDLFTKRLTSAAQKPRQVPSQDLIRMLGKSP